MKNKKTPMRMCLGCREMKDKRELVRIVRTPENVIKVDKTGKASGRGAYVCPVKECLEKSIRSKALSRAFATEIPEEVFLHLKEEIDDKN